MKYGFVIDNRKCIGCHACTVACKAEHDVPVGVNRTWVKYIEKGSFPDTRRHFSVMRCNHCDDAPCIEICPVSSLFRREDGIVDFDSRRCIGCKACMQACPYDALYIDPQTHTASKCNYCAHRIDIGLEPACVNVCPEGAIVSGDMDNPQTKISGLLAKEQVSARKVEKGTHPKLFYIEGDHASLIPTLSMPKNNYMWSSQSKGVGHFAKKTKTFHFAGNQSESGSEVASRVYDSPNKGVLWGKEVSAYVWTKAISCGVFFILFFLHNLGFIFLPQTVRVFGVSVSLIFLALTGALLIKDLDRPERFLYVLLRPQWRSWLVRGAYLISAYGLVLMLWFLNIFFLRNYLIDQTLMIFGLILAPLVAIYTAFLFAQSKGRDLWQSPMLSIHMVMHSILTGSAVILLSSYFFSDLVPLQLWMRWILIISILLQCFFLFIEFFTSHVTSDAKTAVNIMMRGRYKDYFWGFVFVLGNVFPVIMLLFFPIQALMILSSIFILMGVLISTHLWVKIPQLIPLS